MRLGRTHLTASFCVPTGQVASDLTPTHTGNDFAAHLRHAAQEMPKAERYHWPAFHGCLASASPFAVPQSVGSLPVAHDHPLCEPAVLPPEDAEWCPSGYHGPGQVLRGETSLPTCSGNGTVDQHQVLLASLQELPGGWCDSATLHWEMGSGLAVAAEADEATAEEYLRQWVEVFVEAARRGMGLVGHIG